MEDQPNLTEKELSDLIDKILPPYPEFINVLQEADQGNLTGSGQRLSDNYSEGINYTDQHENNKLQYRPNGPDNLDFEPWQERSFFPVQPLNYCGSYGVENSQYYPDDYHTYKTENESGEYTKCGNVPTLYDEPVYYDENEEEEDFSDMPENISTILGYTNVEESKVPIPTTSEKPKQKPIEITITRKSIRQSKKPYVKNTYSCRLKGQKELEEEVSQEQQRELNTLMMKNQKFEELVDEITSAVEKVSNRKINPMCLWGAAAKCIDKGVNCVKPPEEKEQTLEEQNRYKADFEKFKMKYYARQKFTVNVRDKPPTLPLFRDYLKALDQLEYVEPQAEEVEKLECTACNPKKPDKHLKKKHRYHKRSRK